jgi:AraC-like DNA-binding protein
LTIAAALGGGYQKMRQMYECWEAIGPSFSRFGILDPNGRMQQRATFESLARKHRAMGVRLLELAPVAAPPVASESCPAAVPCPACAVGASESPRPGSWYSLRLLFRGSLGRLVQTRCVHDGEDAAAERWHSTPVLYVSFTGASLVRSGRRTLQADPATAIWNRGGEPYETRHPWGYSCQGCHIGFAPELGNELDAECAVSHLGPRALPLAPAQHLRLRWLVGALAGGEFVPPLHVEEELIGVARAALEAAGGGDRGPRRSDTFSTHERCVARAKGLLHERYRETLRLEDLARAACASPAHLTRIFKRQTGMSLHVYQTRLRLAAALEYVLESEMDLASVAHELGFASHSHLTATFRREFGRAPGELRRDRGAAPLRVTAERWPRRLAG